MTDVPGGDVAVVSTAEALERMAHTVAELEARARLVVITVLDDQQAMEAMKEETFSSIRALADALGLPSPRHRWTGRHGTAQAPLPRAAHAATIDEAVEAMLLRSEWRDPTRRNCRHYLCGRRFRGFCQTSRIATVDELTTDHVEQFMDQQRGLISNKTREGYRRYLRALAAFQRDVPGYGQGLADMGRVKKPTLPRRPPAAPSLSREQEDTCVRAASGRDRLILELLLATGMRVSELCGLQVSDLHLDPREGPSWVHVRGSIHDPELTKSGEDRKVPFRQHYHTLPARLRAQLADRAWDRHLFDSQRGLDEQGRPAPLTTSGVEQICKRLSARVGFHVHPHLCRHTWATRCVDGGIGMFHVQMAGGWKSIEMVRRYYRSDRRETP